MWCIPLPHGTAIWHITAAIITRGTSNLALTRLNREFPKAQPFHSYWLNIWSFKRCYHIMIIKWCVIHTLATWHGIACHLTHNSCYNHRLTRGTCNLAFTRDLYIGNTRGKVQNKKRYLLGGWVRWTDLLSFSSAVFWGDQSIFSSSSFLKGWMPLDGCSWQK